MTVMTQIILAVALVLSIIVPFGYYFIGEKSRGRYKTTIATNAFFFFGTMLVAAMVMFAGSSSVQAATGADAGIATGLGYIAAALVTGLSCIGGEKSQPEGFQDHIQVGSFQEFGKIPPGEGKCHYFISFCGERIQGNEKQWDHKDNNCPDKVRNDQALKLFHQ